MNDEPIKAAELVRKTHGGLSRYRTIPDTLTDLSGRLEDVQTTPDDDVWIVVRPVDGLNEGDFATGTIRRPTAKIDRLLEGIGQNGQITLIGIANASKDGIAQLRMNAIRTINGTKVGGSQK